MWMEGPTFLKDDESTWPAVLPLKENAEETSDCKRQTKTRTSRYSNLTHLVHVTGWVQRFLSNFRLPKDLQRKDGSPLSDGITVAETFWIKQAQARAFSDGENEGSLIRLNP